MTRRFLLLAIDISMTFLAGVIALFIRLGFNWQELSIYFPSIPIYTLIASIVYILNGTYRVVWLYASFKDMLLLIRGSLIAYLSVVLFFDFFDYVVLPRSVGAMTFLGSLLLVMASRFFWQWLNILPRSNSTKRVMIIGAGDAGNMLLEDFERRPGLGKVVAFLDDSPRKIGRKIRGIPVFGPIDRAMDVVKLLKVDEVIVAIPSAKGEEMRRIIETLDTKVVRVRTLPGIYELTDGKARIGQLRDVSIEDLLGREQVNVDFKLLRSSVERKRILVTGAGGSIGSELCRQISLLEPSDLILLGKGENSIYQIDQELAEKFPELRRNRVIADVADELRMRQVFRTFHPQVVFHAAAHKHVPLMEENPYEALRVNALGTKVMVELCCEFNVEKMILISTDKAVNPVSVMGLSKRIAELALLSKAQESDNTKFSIVRFGNVLGSRGSVIPKFRIQIEKGGPVTVTDPRMTRYFMTIPEAVMLILQASAYGTGGDLFILDMGRPIPIEKLARSMIELAGFVPDQDIEIVYTGVRKGEKLSEELLYENEITAATGHPKIMRAQSTNTVPFERICTLIEEAIRISVEDPKDVFNKVLDLVRGVHE